MSVMEVIRDTPGVLGWVGGHAPSVKKTLAAHTWLSPWTPIKVVDSMLRGIGQVCFADNPISGALILLGLFLGNVEAGAGAIVCSLSAIITALVFQQGDGALGAGVTNFSAVLVGTVISSVYPVLYGTPLPPQLWGFMIAGASFSVCILAGLGHVLAPCKLPALTLPFNVATTVVFMCVKLHGLSGASVISPDQHDVANFTDDIEWGQVFLGSLLSGGQAYAVNSVALSCLLLLALALHSPTLAIASYLGGLVSTLTALAVSSSPYSAIYEGGWGYNGFLAGGCLVIFQVPSLRILLLAMLNAVFATFLHSALTDSFALNGLPVFTFPFCISSLLFLAMARAGGMDSARVEEPTFPERHYILHSENRRCDALGTPNKDVAINLTETNGGDK